MKKRSSVKNYQERGSFTHCTLHTLQCHHCLLTFTNGSKVALRYLSATLNNLALLTYFFHILRQYSSITFVVTGYRCIYLSAELPKNTVLQVMMTYHDPSLWRAFCTCAGCITKDTATEPPKKRSADNLLHSQLVNLIEDTSFNFLQPANNCRPFGSCDSIHVHLSQTGSK